MADTEHNRVLRRFHTLCNELGISSANKKAIVEGQGVESSKDIPTRTLNEICEQLRRQSDPKAAQMDALRKRVMASVGGWLTAAGYKSNSGIIKSVACRASGYDDFNKIPAARLHNIYHNFRNKQIDKITADNLIGELLTHKADVEVQNPGNGGHYDKSVN